MLNTKFYTMGGFSVPLGVNTRFTHVNTFGVNTHFVRVGFPCGGRLTRGQRPKY